MQSSFLLQSISQIRKAFLSDLHAPQSVSCLEMASAIGSQIENHAVSSHRDLSKSHPSSPQSQSPRVVDLGGHRSKRQVLEVYDSQLLMLQVSMDQRW